MLTKTKLDEDIPGGSSAESVPTSNELDDAALIAVSSTVGGLVAVTGTPSNGAAIVLLLHGHLQFPEEKRSSRLAVGCFRRWATDPPLDSSSCSVGRFRGVHNVGPPVRAARDESRHCR